MGVFDQSARFAAQADPHVVPQRLLRDSRVKIAFRELLDTRTLPLPGGPDRSADLVAALDAPSGQPWLCVLEFQAQPDVDKLDVTLEEVAVLRARARHGEERRGKYRVAAGLIYLVGTCPEEVIDMTLPDGRGTRHVALVWNVAQDDALATVEAVASGVLLWGMLFWVPLMRGGSEDALIARWKDVVTEKVADRQLRGTLAAIALIFAELSRCVPQWRRGLEGLDMTESQVVNEWITRGELRERRRALVEIVNGRFAGAASPEVLQLIQHQDSMELLRDCSTAAIGAASYDEFLAVLKH